MGVGHLQLAKFGDLYTLKLGLGYTHTKLLTQKLSRLETVIKPEHLGTYLELALKLSMAEDRLRAELEKSK